MTITDTARINMIQSQIRTSDVLDSRLLNVIASVPRHTFVPAELKGIAYIDNDLPLGNGRYLLEPALFARMVDLASIHPTDSVLDIGCASGYSTAVLAGMADKVVAIETDTELSSKANFTLHNLGIENAIIINGNLADGHAEGAPYDVIFIGGAVEEVPSLLLSQLAEGGRLVAIVQSAKNISHVVLYELHRGVISSRTAFEAYGYVLPGFTKKQTLFQMATASA